MSTYILLKLWAKNRMKHWRNVNKEKTKKIMQAHCSFFCRATVFRIFFLGRISHIFSKLPNSSLTSRFFVLKMGSRRIWVKMFVSDSNVMGPYILSPFAFYLQIVSPSLLHMEIISPRAFIGLFTSI
jgi:hypothetical protein